MFMLNVDKTLKSPDPKTMHHWLLYYPHILKVILGEFDTSLFAHINLSPQLLPDPPLNLYPLNPVFFFKIPSSPISPAYTL